MREFAMQAYRDLLLSASTDDDQVNDLTGVRSIQRVLQIDDFARTLLESALTRYDETLDPALRHQILA